MKKPLRFQLSGYLNNIVLMLISSFWQSWLYKKLTSENQRKEIHSALRYLLCLDCSLAVLRTMMIGIILESVEYKASALFSIKSFGYHKY